MKRIRHGRRSSAFSLVEAIVVVVILAVLVAILLPMLAKPRRKPKRINCVNNLKHIGISFRVWAMNNNDKFPMQVSVTNGGTMELAGTGAAYPHFRVLSNELNTPKILVCPGDKKAGNEMGKVMAAHALARGTNRGYTPPFFPTNLPVSYFVGVDARPDRPRMFLSGDANLAVHGRPAQPGLTSLWTNSPVAWAKPFRLYHDEGGYILLADADVEQAGDVRLRELLIESSAVTNRLALP